MLPADLLLEHPDITILTLDFFDTLVTRAVAQPTHVFAVMEQRLVERHGRRWTGFALRRVEAERRARAVMANVDEHSDITLDDILREIALDIGISVDERAQLSSLEQDVEVELAVRVNFGAELLEEALRRGLRVLVVSDNYMPAAQLVRMARAAGISLDESQVIVSCEHGAMKHDGSLWPRVLEIAGVDPACILHVGDLHDVDGRVPARFGIHTHVNDAMRRSHREPLNTSPAVLPLSRMEAASRDQNALVPWDTALNSVAGAVALVVAGQVLDIEHVARERPLAGVHFTSRDGYLAHKVYASLWAEDRTLPPPGYVEISRSVTWRALLTEMNPETAQRFVGDNERLSVSTLSARFGCDLHHSDGTDVVLDAPSARDFLIMNAQIIEASCRSLRTRLMEYLDKTVVTSPGHHVLMDLGWSGSVVADLAQIIKEERGDEMTFEGRLTGLYWEASTNRQRIPLHGLAFDEFRTMDDNVRMLGFIRFFESLMTAPHGSVVDYRDATAIHSPVWDVPEIPGLTWEGFASSVLASAIAIVRGSHPLVRKDEVTGDVVRAAMLQVGHTPTHAEVGIFGGVRHETAIDHAGGGRELVGTSPPCAQLGDIPSVYEDLLRNHWVQGTLESWSGDDSSRWISDEVRRFGPMMHPQWVAR